MLQETVNERFDRECAQLELTSVRRPIAKGHLVIFEFDQAVVADGNAENIGGQIFQSRATIANWFTVNDPILLPDLRRYSSKQGCFHQRLPELASKYPGECLDR